MTAKIGHNGGPTFSDIVRENLDRGSLITIKEVIIEAVRDPRLERRHLRVLAEIIDCMNTQTGVAFPGRKALAEKVRQGDLRLSESGRDRAGRPYRSRRAHVAETRRRG